MYSFSNVSELESQVKALPTAREERVMRVEEFDESMVPDWKAIVNNENDEVATIVTDKYNLVQHREAFRPVIRVLNELKFSWEGEIRTWKEGGRVVANISSPEMGFEIDEDSEYGGGFQVLNSFDGSAGFRLTAFVKRLVCSNGMVLREAITEPYYKKHLGEDIVEEVKDWIRDLGEELPYLRNRIIASQNEYFEPFKALEALGVPDKHAEAIVPTENKREISRKELYDRFTSYLSHEYREEDQSLSTEQSYWRKSEELLIGDLDWKIDQLEMEEA